MSSLMAEVYVSDCQLWFSHCSGTSSCVSPKVYSGLNFPPPTLLQPKCTILHSKRIGIFTTMPDSVWIQPTFKASNHTSWLFVFPKFFMQARTNLHQQSGNITWVQVFLSAPLRAADTFLWCRQLSTELTTWYICIFLHFSPNKQP